MKVLCFGVLFLFSGIGSAIEFRGCPNRFESYYPKCDSDENNYGYDYTEKKYVPICPSISDGEYPPDCKCRYGTEYDPKTNSCPDPECPFNSTTISSYPNCECVGKNREYNENLNECVLVCPEDSTGRFPDCKCDDKLAGFSKEWFRCDRCPADSLASSIYPNCQCDNAAYLAGLWGNYLNKCKKCPHGTSGIYPDCVCDNDNTGPYAPETYGCELCPWYSKGEFPNCYCERNGTNVRKDQAYGYRCFECPSGSDGLYPECFCDEPSYYNDVANSCDICPDGTVRLSTFPYCKCNNENAFFVPGFSQCRECPENSKGKFPNCECDEKYHLFSAFINQCYPECIEPSKYELEFNMTGCVERYAFPNRPCPPDSIGTSPECKCFGNKVFVVYGWGCYEPHIFAYGIQKCQFKEHKFPQCDVSIDRKVLLSLVG